VSVLIFMPGPAGMAQDATGLGLFSTCMNHDTTPTPHEHLRSHPAAARYGLNKTRARVVGQPQHQLLSSESNSRGNSTTAAARSGYHQSYCWYCCCCCHCWAPSTCPCPPRSCSAAQSACCDADVAIKRLLLPDLPL
jgi:hypothetical protein